MTTFLLPSMSIFLRWRVLVYPGEGRVREDDGQARPRTREGRPVLNAQVVKKNTNYPLMKQIVHCTVNHDSLSLKSSLFMGEIVCIVNLQLYFYRSYPFFFRGTLAPLPSSPPLCQYFFAAILYFKLCILLLLWGIRECLTLAIPFVWLCPRLLYFKVHICIVRSYTSLLVIYPCIFREILNHQESLLNQEQSN